MFNYIPSEDNTNVFQSNEEIESINDNSSNTITASSSAISAKKKGKNKKIDFLGYIFREKLFTKEYLPIIEGEKPLVLIKCIR